MTRTTWIVLGLAVLALALYVWSQKQVTRVPVGTSSSAAPMGLLDSISHTVSKLTEIFGGIGGTSASNTTKTTITVAGEGSDASGYV